MDIYFTGHFLLSEQELGPSGNLHIQILRVANFIFN